MNKKVLVVGGGSLQVPLIKKINDMGYISLCVDKNPNAEGFLYARHHEAIDIIDKEKCLKYALSNEIDGVLTVATDFPIETVSYIAQRMNLVGIPYETAKLVKNKYLVKKKLFENGLFRSIQFFEVSNIEELNKIKDNIHYPIIVKPCDGSGSKSIHKLDSNEQLENVIIDAIETSKSKKAFIETFITGQEYGVESIVINGKVNVLGIMKKYMTEPPYYAELGHSIPSGLSNDIENKIKKIVTTAINVLEINNGSVNMDLILTSNGDVNIIDVGARMGGNLIGSHIIPNATGIDILEALVNIVLKNNVDVNKRFSRNISTRILDFGPGKIKDIKSFEDIIDGKKVVDIVLNKRIGDISNIYKSNADSFGWLVVSGNTPEETEKFADKMKKQVRDRFIIER